MLKAHAGLMLGLLVALPLAAAEPQADAKTQEQEANQQLEQFRDDLQALETEVVSKTISLTTEEATTFWPIFKEFQREQKQVIEGQLDAVRKYAGNYENLSDADAVAYVNGLLERDRKIQDLRAKYLAKYATVLSPGKAARVIHISRRLGLASQAKLASVIPLVR